MATRNYDSEYDNYQGTPAQKKNRAQRNKARRLLEEQGRVSPGDGMDVDHKIPMSKGGKTTPKNLRVQRASANRSFKRNSKGGIK